MKKLHAANLVFLMSMLFTLKAFAVDQNWDAAKQVVESTTEKVIDVMSDSSLFEEENRERLQSEVEQIVTPVIDFYGFGRGVMGRFSRSASEEQLERFASVLKTTLIRTYSMAVSEFSIREYTITPPRAPSPQPEMQVVNVQLTSTAGKTYIFSITCVMLTVIGCW